MILHRLSFRLALVVLAALIPVLIAFAVAPVGVGPLRLATAAVSGFGGAWLAAELLIGRRLRRAASAVSDLATGDLSARSRLPHGGGELGQLARAFDEMAARLDAMTRHNRLVFEATGEGILSLGPDGRVRSANSAAASLLGLRGPLVGRCAHTLVHGPNADHTAKDCPLSNAADSAPREDTFRRADGVALSVQVVSSALREGRRVTGTVVVFADTTERRRLEEQLRQAAKMEAVGRLAGGVAHDFNNLLTAILGYGDLMRLRLGARHPLQRELAEILRAAQRAAALTRQLLAFSRRRALATQVIDLHVVALGLEKMLRRLIGEDVALQLDLQAPAPRLLADPGQIEQVLMNLAVNARDAMPGGGVLTFRTREVGRDEAAGRGLGPGRWMLVEVSDTGMGMDAATAARIFEPFFTTKATGTGLGLSMVYGIVRQSGGELTVDSAPGAGASFQLWMPLTDAAETSAADPASAQPSRGDETVLVVEDDLAVRSLVCRTLEEAGYEVIEASDGRQARALVEVRGESVDLLVTDVIMPGISGRELARQLLRRHPELRVLYMSGYTDGELAPHHLDNGAFLAKPFGPTELLARVRDVLDTGGGRRVRAASGM